MSYGNFSGDTSYEQVYKYLSWMMDEFIHWPKPYLLSPATYDETLSWMLEIWMKNHPVCDSNCNTINLLSPKKITKKDK
jgi:hypothetical protein